MRVSIYISLAFFLFIGLCATRSFAQCGSIQGSATALTGETKNYSYCYSSQTFVSPIWTITKGVVLSSSLSPDAMTAYATVRWDVNGTGTISLRDGVILQTRNVTISCSTMGNPTFSPTSPYVCGSGSVTLTGMSGSGGNSVRYYSALTGGTLLKTGGAYTTPVISTTTPYYIVSYNTTSLCESTPRVLVTVTANVIPSVPATTTPGTACYGYSAVLSATPGANGTQIKWFDAATNGNLLGTGNSFTTPALTNATTFYAATYNAAGTCSSSRTGVLASIVAGPANAQGGTDDVIYGAGTTVITITPGTGGNNIRWYDNDTGGSYIFQGTAFTTPVLTAPKTYYVSTYSSTLNCESFNRVPVSVTVIPVISPSSLKQEVVRTPGVTQDIQLYSLTSAQKNTQVSYFDGLLRAHQQVIQGASPTGNDIVQPVEFDSYGRASKSYLPYVASTANGSYKGAYKIDQATFYNNTSDKVADDLKPYALAKFERSPIGRVLEQTGVGDAWYSGGGHKQKVKYSYNTGSTGSEAEEVRLFKSDGSSTTFYSANLLTRTLAADEDGKITIVFADKAGKVLVKKQQLGEVIDAVTVNYLQTYYVYDDFDRIKYIISPKGVAALRASSWPSTISQSVLDQYVHQFVYDSRGRLIEKKVPGQAWMYYAYDKLNRVVLTQDGLLRASNKWMFVKYDSKGRAVMQGLYLNAAQVRRDSIQALLNRLYKSTNPTYPANAYYESRGTALHGYTNTSFPKVNADSSPIEIWNVMYFESHDFENDGTRVKYDSGSFNGSGQATTSNWRARGLATGSKRLVLGTSTWLYTYVYYDKYNRVIQVKSNNHMSSALDNVATTVYDFEGKVLTTKNYHNAGGGKITTVVNKYTYDTKGRLVKIFQNNNAAANDQLVAQYEYNELGQMVDKKLHETAVGNQNFLQSVDYRYTIRGQLSSINNASLDGSTAINNETNDYFGMEFLYNTAESGLNDSIYFNGNISAVKWKGVGAGSGTTDQKSYKFTYDKSNKLETATSQMYAGSTWTKEADALNESMSYDHNGNIKSLQRNQRLHFLNATTGKGEYSNQQIDNLTYSYSSTIGDQLLKVEDAAANTNGFNNGANIATEYTYDINGNVTLDKNKGIDSVHYNFLGKVRRVKFTDGRIITYIYDAAGSKLTMKTFSSGAWQTTDYVDGFVYENNVLSFFGSPEGRVVKNGSAMEYQYAIADHQGNTRVVFTSATPAVQSTPTVNFEAASNSDVNNYPTGGSRSGWELFDHTDFSGSIYTYSHLLNGGNNSQVGVSKSFAVYPGDKVKIEAYAKYYNPQSNNSNLAGFALALTGAFGVSAASTGEAALAYQGLNNYGAIVVGGGRPSDSGYPKLFVTILLFDKNYKFLDVAYEQINGGLQSGVSSKATHDHMVQEYTVKEVGYAYAYISNESGTYVEGYFDDVVFTHTPTSVIQYNEYYPFGLQGGPSWTRGANTNNFLYNAGNELNKNSGWYEMFYRGYDPTLGRMLQVDPYATSYTSHTPYNYALNNPAILNDPSGGYVPLANNFGRELADRAFANGWSIDFESAFTGGAFGTSGISRMQQNVLNRSEMLRAAEKARNDAEAGDASAMEEYGKEYGVQAKLELWERWYITKTQFGVVDSEFLGYFFKRVQTQEEEADKFHYFTDESKAIQFMLDKQKQDKGEVTAMMVKNSKGVNMVIVQPWRGNKKFKASSWARGVYPDEGYKRMVIKGVEFTILASVHTHPEEAGSYQGPSGVGGDYDVYNLTNGLSMFTIGPSEVSKLNPQYPFKNTVWSDTTGTYIGNRHKIGSTTGLINGDYSLFNFLGK